jgi:ribosomal-protein-alanine N-acetyltransferase
MSVLETERMVLRPFREGDLEDLAALHADPEVTRFLGGSRPRTRQETAEKLRKTMEHWRQHGFGIFALVEKEAGDFVGHCGAAYLHGMGDAELAYSLAKPCWGRGLATEAATAVLRHAFDVVGLPRVVAVAVADNIASQKVMAKVGMTLQGPYQFDGRSAVLYAIEKPAVLPRP